VIFFGLGLVFLRPLGAFGIALASSLGFTVEAAILFLLLKRACPEIRRSWSTFPRAVAGSILGAALAYAAMAWLPMAILPSTLIGLVVGGAMTLAFVLPEIRELRRL
jgi:peptidoglycan biosynthesis protein MviN/MurJ (putative lipid II flippase)